MLEFMRLGYKVGRGVCGRLTEPAVDKITKAVQFAEREAHFVSRFFCALRSTATFLSRRLSRKTAFYPLSRRILSTVFPGEDFMIFDRTHKLAFII